MNRHEKVLRQVVDEIIDLDPECSIVVCGSVAGGYTREDSDIDLLVYLSKEPTRYIADIRPDNRGKCKHTGARDGVELDVSWGLLANLPQEIKDDDACVWYPHIKVKIMHDPSGAMERLIGMGKRWLAARPWIVEAWEEQLEKMRRHKADPTCPIKFGEKEFKEHMRQMAAQRKQASSSTLGARNER